MTRYLSNAYTRTYFSSMLIVCNGGLQQVVVCCFMLTSRVFDVHDAARRRGSSDGGVCAGFEKLGCKVSRRLRDNQRLLLAVWPGKDKRINLLVRIYLSIGTIGCHP